MRHVTMQELSQMSLKELKDLSRGIPIQYRPQALDYVDFKWLERDIDWQEITLKVFGRECKQPRLSAWFDTDDNSYSYSGATLEAQQWPGLVTLIKDKLEKGFGVELKQCLGNYYRDGSDYVSWHSDDERELGKDPYIISVSFGAARTFKIRNKYGTKRAQSFVLSHGDILVMESGMQYDYEHSLAKTKKAVGPRINLTFRGCKR